MTSKILPESLQITLNYSNIRRLNDDANEDKAHIYEGNRGLNPVIIRQCNSDQDENSFQICQNLKGLYILIGLEKFYYNGMDFVVYEKHTSLEDWIRTETNVVQNGTFTQEFLQILRDAFRGVQYLFTIKKFHGRFGMPSIAVVEDGTNYPRGKLMNFLNFGNIGDDVFSIVSMINDTLHGFVVNEVKKLEMEALSKYLMFCVRGDNSILRNCMVSLHNYPVFLNNKMRIELRIAAVKRYRILKKDNKDAIRENLPDNKEETPWKACIRKNPYSDMFYNIESYGTSGVDFMVYSRNVLSHMNKNILESAIDIMEHELDHIWPGFLAELFNAFTIAGVLLLDKEGSLS